MKDAFEIAGGTVAGRDHVACGRNNQDAFAWHQDERCTIAVVADGCSEGLHSEVGAKLLARIITNQVVQAFDLGIPGHRYIPGRAATEAMIAERPEEFFVALRRASMILLKQIACVAGQFAYGHSLNSGATGWCDPDVVRDCFLATVVGVIVTERVTIIFSCGDGAYAVNGAAHEIGPFPNNMPPYLAYGLLCGTPTPSHSPSEGGGEKESEERERRRSAFTVHAVLPTREVQSLLLGTDGVVDIIAAADRKIPGRDESVGQLAQFWTDDRFFRNPDMVRRRLTVINRESVRIESGALVREQGLLLDDTTVVVIRQRKSTTSSS